MRFDVVGVREGLSQNNVTSIAQDSEGFIWFGTENGLNRFDGKTFRTYYSDRSDTSRLRSDFIWEVAEDSHHDLWLATEGSGVVKWSRRTNTFLSFLHAETQANSLSSDIVRSIYIDRQQRIWAGTRSDGLNILEPRTGEVVRFVDRAPDLFRGRAVLDITQSADGFIWAATDGGLIRIDPDTLESARFIPTGGSHRLAELHITTLLAEQNGVLWVGTAQTGLHRLDPNGSIESFTSVEKDQHTLSNNHIQALFVDDRRRLWVGTVDGLNLLDRESGSFSRFRSSRQDPDGLRSADIMSIFQDRSGMLWVGTRAAGAHKWNPRSWSFGHRALDVGEATITSFAEIADDSVLIGTVEHGLSHFRVSSGAIEPWPAASRADLSDSKVMALLRTRRNEFWVGTMTGGVNILDSSGKMLRRLRADSSSNAIGADGVMALYEDTGGNIWIGTFGGGLSIHTSEGKRLHSSQGVKKHALYNSRVTCFEQDRNGNVWIGTDSGGLLIVDSELNVLKSLRAIDGGASIGSNTIYDIHRDASGRMWLAVAGSGVDQLTFTGNDYASIQIRNYTRKHGLPSNVAYAIYEDAAGTFWISSNGGLARLDAVSGQFTAFHREQGTQDEEFNFGAHLRTASGMLLFGGNNGFNAFAPDAIESSTYAAPVVLTSFQKQNTEVGDLGPPETLHKVDIRHSDRVVSFEVALLDFTAPDANRYVYRLTESGPDWISLGTSRRVTLNDLTAGDHELLINAANSDGVWSETPVRLSLTVAPAPWRTPLAYSLYAVLALLTIAWIAHRLRERTAKQAAYSRELEAEVQRRTEELQQRNQELRSANQAKGEFLARMSHEVRTPINGVLGMSDLLARGALDGVQQRCVRVIHKSAESLLALVNDILDFSRGEAGKIRLDPVPCDLHDLIDETIELFAIQAERKYLVLRCDIDPTVPRWVLLDPLRLRQVLINLLSNSLKFTERGSIEVTATASSAAGATKLTVAVVDTGAGIPESYRSRLFESFSQADSSTSRRHGGTGLGLAICRQLMDLMDGTIELEAARGGGTRASITLPLSLVAGAEDRSGEMSRAPPDGTSAFQDPSGLSLRVLVVEDNAVNQEVMCGFLAALKCRAKVAADGVEAVELCKSERFDVVLMDCHLPGMDGFEVARRIRNLSSPNSHTPIVAWTADNPAAVQASCERAGIFHYLSKPASLTELRTVLGSAALRSQATGDQIREQAGADSSLLDRSILTAMRQLTTAGAPSLANRVVELYLVGSTQTLAALDAAFASSDWDGMGRHAHALKSASRNVGATALSVACGRFEKFAEERSPNVNGELRGLTILHQQTLQELRNEFQSAA